METRESINRRYNEKTRKYFRVGSYGFILGLAITASGFYIDSRQTGNIPTVYPLSKSNLAIAFVGISSMWASAFVPIALSNIARRKRDSKLESLSHSTPELQDMDLPYLP